MFGGTLMANVDEIAAITAMKHTSIELLPVYETIASYDKISPFLIGNKKSTESVDAVTTELPAYTNHHHTMFGGTLMANVDEIAAITAMKHAGNSVVYYQCTKPSLHMIKYHHF
jgi:acyl-CoA hydrolase